MKPRLSLSSFYLKNFKAVQDSKKHKITSLTLFIGNNGSGKSSIVEAMEAFQSVRKVRWKREIQFYERSART